ncbi:hypothetical protein [Nocardia sp. CC227C]|uniref:hypothetical protein n=1 Tax=Nocardia sp. CC227C TaxID=3044562 RepID=UPI00278C03A7|nr:hypothetical protein [Nocardia sp. CC227C]
MLKARKTAVATVAAIFIGGCSSTPQEDLAVPVCTSTFDLHDRAEPLGAGERLNAELTNFIRSAEPFLMVDVTRAAGWSDEWDRMVQVSTGTTAEKLNRNAGTEYCWENLPTSAGFDESYPPEFYLFTRDGQPVQTVRWPEAVSIIQFGDHDALTKESVLTVDAEGWIVPQ